MAPTGFATPCRGLCHPARRTAGDASLLVSRQAASGAGSAERPASGAGLGWMLSFRAYIFGDSGLRSSLVHRCRRGCPSSTVLALAGRDLIHKMDGPQWWPVLTPLETGHLPEDWHRLKVQHNFVLFTRLDRLLID